MKAIVKFNNLFITSKFNMATLKKVAKFRPEALNLTKGEGKEKTTVCVLSVGDKASYSPYGLVFAKDSVTAPNVATMAVELPSTLKTTDDINEWVRDKFGLSIVNCEKIEAQVDAAMTEINADEAAMNAAITIENEVAPEAEAADAE